MQYDCAVQLLKVRAKGRTQCLTSDRRQAINTLFCGVNSPLWGLRSYLFEIIISHAIYVSS